MSHKTIFTITVDTKKPLTDEQVVELRNSIGDRLQGYQSKCPEFLRGQQTMEL